MWKITLLVLCTLYVGSYAQNTTAPVAVLDDGDTSWVLISTALVMFMTPGLAFFYGGMVSWKCVLNTVRMIYLPLDRQRIPARAPSSVWFLPTLQPVPPHANALSCAADDELGCFRNIVR